MPLYGDRTFGRLERVGVVLAWLAAAALLLFLAVPLLSVVWRMAQERSELAPVALTTLRDALILSLITSGLSLAVIIVFGTPLAYLLSRRRFRGAHLVETLIDIRYRLGIGEMPLDQTPEPDAPPHAESCP